MRKCEFLKIVTGDTSVPSSALKTRKFLKNIMETIFQILLQSKVFVIFFLMKLFETKHAPSEMDFILDSLSLSRQDFPSKSAICRFLLITVTGDTLYLCQEKTQNF